MQAASTTDNDKSASIAIPDGGSAVWIGWPKVIERLQRAITERGSSKPILIVECYPGVNAEVILQQLQQQLKPAIALNASTALHASKRMETLVRPYVADSKSRLVESHTLTLPEFFDAERLWHARREIEDLREGLVVIVGCGASLIAWGQVLVYADLTRSEARSHLSRQDCANLGLENHGLATEEKFRIASRVDWPVADRWKRPLITHWDFVLETKPTDVLTLFDGEAVQRGLKLAVQRPFRFASGSTAETTRSNIRAIGDAELISANNNSDARSAWQEESFLLSFGAVQLELPALDLVMAQPRALLGDAAFLQFGYNCPLPHLAHDLSVSSSEPVHHGEGWSEERYISSEKGDRIETRKLHFTRGVPQATNGAMLVLELVDGPKLSVESPSEAFAPLVFHRGQRFIVPAAIGEVVLRPAGLSQDRPWVVLKALVKTRT